MIKYRELSNQDLEALALIITETGHADDIEIEFRVLKNMTAEVVIRIVPEKQYRQKL